MIVAVLVCAALDPSIVVGILGVVAAAFAPLLGYLAARRQLSGKIETSEARELWAESKAIREWSSRRIQELEDQNTALSLRVDHLEEENADLQRRLAAKVGA